MSIAIEETFTIPTSYYDQDSQYKQQLIKVLGMRFDKGECKLYRNLDGTSLPVILIRVLEWSDRLIVHSLSITKEEGLQVLIQGEQSIENYQIDPLKFSIQSQDIIDSAYRVILYGDTGYSSFIIELVK